MRNQKRNQFSTGITPGAASWLLLVLLFSVAGAISVRAQKAYVSDAWWTYQQDCNGDGCKAGTLVGNFARLNWSPAVTNCNGILNVYEKVFYRPCGTTEWIPIYTNATHTIVGCRSTDQQYVDISMGDNCECREYKIEVYRAGIALPDHARSSSNDPDLAQRIEQNLASDYCLSDFFASCVMLEGRNGSQSDNSSYATREMGEPLHAGNPGGHSLWYCWTAPTNRPVTIDTIGSSFDTLLAVYTGDNLENLTLVASNDDIAGATNRMSSVTFTPNAGTTYRIAVDGFGGASGNVTINWNQTGSALPDLIVWGPAASPYVINTTFSSSSCEVVEGCATPGTRRLLRFNMETRNIGAGDLVLGNPATNPLFVFATCHGHYHFESFAQYELLDTNGVPVVAGHKAGFCIEDVSKWSPTAPRPFALYTCSFNGLQAGWADVYTADVPCQYIDITGLPAGDYILQLTVNPDNLLPESNIDNNTTLIPLSLPPTNCISPPPNDAFENAIVLGEAVSSVSEFNMCASKQVGEPNHAGRTGGRSIWYRWTAPSNHIALITTQGSRFDTLLAVYTGNSVSSLTVVTNNDDISPAELRSRVTFNAVAGTTYHIAIDGAGGALGLAVLNINPDRNDDFADAFILTGTSGSVRGSNLGASKQSGEPAHAYDVGGHSLWYRWTAPTNGFVDFNTAGSSFDTTLAVYTNTTLAANNLPIAFNDDDVELGGLLTSRLWFYAVAGRTYWIAVDGYGGDVGELKLTWNMDSRLSIENLPDGTIKLTLTGVDWQRYVLLGSSNLLDWTTNWAAITMNGGAHHYTNFPGTNGDSPGLQLYRAILVP